MGTDVTGSYTYDSDLVDSLANSNTIDKFQSNTAINASFDWEITFALGTESRTVTSADRAFTFILNDKAADQYSFSAGGLANITLNDNNSDAIQNLSNSAPTSATDLSLFGSIKNDLYKIEGSENQLSFRINSITPASASVPEPSMAAVVSIGFLSLAVMSWRRKRES